MVCLPKPQHSTHGVGVEAGAEARQEKEAGQGTLNKLHGELPDPGAGMGGGGNDDESKRTRKKKRVNRRSSVNIC